MLLLYLAMNLNEQAFLQVACAKSGGVKVLDNLQCFFQFLLGAFDAGVDGKFITDAIQRLT